MSTAEETQLAVIKNDIDHMKDDLKDIKETLQQNYVTQDQFRPVRTFVYGLIGISLTSILVAVINMILKAK